MSHVPVLKRSFRVQQEVNNTEFKLYHLGTIKISLNILLRNETEVVDGKEILDVTQMNLLKLAKGTDILFVHARLIVFLTTVGKST